ncbi:MAG: DUF1801 domain-containing protein [Phycisphaerae bacterium]|nr:DUF1801 domain-containing protein [Phycisphaerae bacterium]
MKQPSDKRSTASKGTARTKPAAAEKRATRRRATTKSRKPDAAASGPVEPKLLSGGNPQIAKGDGDAPVQEFIAAMPGWKRDVGRRLDALIEKAAPGVRKAVKWNTPFYGARDSVDGRDWFLGFHCFNKYVKVAFLRGSSLQPLPPIDSKMKDARYLHIHEGEAIDEPQFISWVRQSSRIRGERL